MNIEKFSPVGNVLFQKAVAMRHYQVIRDSPGQELIGKCEYTMFGSPATGSVK